MATSRRQRLGVFVAIATVSFAFALFLGWFVGAWLILPFAGMEVGVVAIAFWWIERHSADCDTITVGDASVSVSRVRGAQRESHAFSRAWVQIDVEQDRYGRARGVRFRQSGRQISLGEFLGETESRVVAQNLRRALKQPLWAAV